MAKKTMEEKEIKVLAQNDRVKEIELFIRSRYPIIYINSFEERRVIDILSKCPSGQSKTIMEWSATVGFKEKNVVDKNITDPIEALNYAIEKGDRTIYIFKDFHVFLKDPIVIRKLRDAIAMFDGFYKTIVILAPITVIPTELEKDIVVVDFDLPSYEEIADIFKTAEDAAKSIYKMEVNLTSEEREQLIKAAQGLTFNEIERVFAKALVRDNVLDIGDLESVIAEKRQIIKRSETLEFYSSDRDFTHIGGMAVLKDWFRRRSKAFSEKAVKYGLPAPKGVMLLGIPGAGKSLIAKSLGSLWNVPVVKLDVGRLMGGIVGDSEKNTRQALKLAEAVSPCILFCDEIEKGFSGVQSSGQSDAGTQARVLGTFLTWLQDKQKPVFVIGTSNSIEQLNPEFLRKGRFDEIFFVDLPNVDEREDIFRIHLGLRSRDASKFNVRALAIAAEGYSGAEIEQTIIDAMYNAFFEEREVETKDIQKAIKEIIPLSKTMAEKMDALRSWADGRARLASDKSITGKPVIEEKNSYPSKPFTVLEPPSNDHISLN